MRKNFRQYGGLNQIAANIDDALFYQLIVNSTDNTVILDANENAATIAVGERHDFLGQAFVVKSPAFEFGGRAFTIV